MALRVHCHVTGVFAENTYVAIDERTSQAAVIDPGEGALEIWRSYQSTGAKLESILLTHAHLDHIMGLEDLKAAYPVPISLHEDDLFLMQSFVQIAAQWGVDVEPVPLPDHFWNHGDRVSIGDTELEIIHTPGHSPGSVSLRWDEGVFTGDALFAGSIGRTDFPRSSLPVLERSIKEQLYTLPEDLVIFPGHMGTSTIGAEKHGNMFVRG